MLKINNPVVKLIIDILENSGYEAYFVGGHVRDLLLGIDSFDEDLVTNASVDEMLDLFKGRFKNVNEVGKRFGVLIVEGIEIAQYRTEVYNNVSKPDVSLTRSLIEDSKRRDFTVNAIYMNKSGKISDPQNGQEDISNKLIRAVGNAKDRFIEDPSRILRGVYLASKLNFDIDKFTQKVMTENKDLLDKVPNELKGKIVMKSIKSGSFYGFIKMLMDLDLIDKIFPEVSHLNKVDQNPKYHCFNAWEHTLEVIKSAEMKKPGNVEFILGALFHDNLKGKLEVRKLNKHNQPSDIGHEELGAPVAENAVLKLSLGKDVAKLVSFYVKYHGVRLDKNCKVKSIVKWLRKISSEFNNIKDLEKHVLLLLEFVECDADGFNEVLKIEVKEMVESLKEKLIYVFSKKLFYVNQLSVNGNDVTKFGIKGKEVKEILERLVIMNETNKERSLQLIEKWSL